VLALALLLIPGFAAAAPRDYSGKPVVVFAAASMKNALDDVNAAWERRSGRHAVVDYAGSNALARQIAQGAPADLFISADREWMEYVSAKGLTQKDSERSLLGNRLVLIAPRASKVRLHIAPGFALASALGGGRLAMCNTAVPAGKYGEAALKTLGVWPSVEQHTAQAQNVRAALALVARGEAPLGIVYATDAAAEPAVRVVDRFPDDTHPPIVYPVALLRGAQPAARDLLQFMEAADARPLFEKQGFTVPATTPATTPTAE
jgi:molybdate transport system substrate-binding protein